MAKNLACYYILLKITFKMGAYFVYPLLISSFVGVLLFYWIKERTKEQLIFTFTIYIISDWLKRGIEHKILDKTEKWKIYII